MGTGNLASFIKREKYGEIEEEKYCYWVSFWEDNLLKLMEKMKMIENKSRETKD